MRVWKHFWAVILMVCGIAAPKANADDHTPPSFQFDKSKYAQLHLQMTGGGNPFDGECPDKDAKFFDVSFDSMFSGGGEQIASLTVELDFPDGRPAQLFELVRIERGKRSGIAGSIGVGTRKCAITFRRINQFSPLFSMSGYENQTFDVTVKLHQRKEGGQGLFTNTVNEVQAASSLVPVLPSGALTMMNAVLPSLQEVGGFEGIVQQEEQILIASSSQENNKRAWVIPPFDGSISEPIIFTTTLVTYDSLYKADSESTSPGNALRRSFDAGQSPPNVRGFLLANAAAELTNFESASNVDQAKGACAALFNKVDEMELTASDSAVLKWALIRGHPGQEIRTDPDMDRLGCAEGIWAFLPRYDDGTLPEAFVMREPLPEFKDCPETGDTIPVGETCPTPPVVTEYRTPNWAEMLGTISQGHAAAATFFKTADRHERKRLGALIFDDLFRVDGNETFSLLSGPSTGPISVSDLILGQWNIDSPLASNFGCLAYSTSEPFDVPEGQIWAIGNLLVGPNGEEKEAVLKFDFTPIEIGAPVRVRVASVTLSEPSETEINVFNARFVNKKCSENWAPEFLNAPL